MAREIEFRDALREAMTEEMRRDPRVFLMGEEVAEYQGAYKVSRGMLDEFGPQRVIDTPISESAFSGLGIGAAMAGLRPIIEFMSWSFSLVAADQMRTQLLPILSERGAPLRLEGSVCVLDLAGATTRAAQQGQRAALSATGVTIGTGHGSSILSQGACGVCSEPPSAAAAMGAGRHSTLRRAGLASRCNPRPPRPWPVP